MTQIQLRLFLIVLVVLCGVQLVVSQSARPTISLGVINDKASVLVFPQVNIQPRISGKVVVKVRLDLVRGRVTEAKAISGHPLLRIASEKAAAQALFPPILGEFDPLFGEGLLVFRVDQFNKQEFSNPRPQPLMKISDFRPEYLNGALVKPIRTDRTNGFPLVCADGRIELILLSRQDNGAVLAAGVIDGDRRLEAEAEAAILKSISPTRARDGADYHVGKTFYEFDPLKNCDNIGNYEYKGIDLPKPRIAGLKLDLNVEKIAVVEIVVDVGGRVMTAKMLAGNPLLAGAVEDAALRSRFKPESKSPTRRLKAMLVYTIRSDGTIQIADGRPNEPIAGLPLEVVNPGRTICNCRFGSETPNVLVEVTVDAAGKVTSSTAITGHPVLKSLSEKAARSSRFLPTAKDEKFVLRYHFESVDEKATDVHFIGVELVAKRRNSDEK